MKLLLDENVPKQLKKDLAVHSVFTVREMGWDGREDGDLLQLLSDEQFDALITCDKNIQFQQNLSSYSTPILLFGTYTNAYPILKTLVPELQKLLKNPLEKGVTIIEL